MAGQSNSVAEKLLRKFDPRPKKSETASYGESFNQFFDILADGQCWIQSLSFEKSVMPNVQLAMSIWHV